MNIRTSLVLASIVMTGAFATSHAGFAAEGDAAKGENVFKRCVACHSLEPGKKKPTGPNLHGVVGRQAGADPDYRYSPAMREAGEGGLIWNDENLLAYLEDPRGFVPRSKMILKLPREQDRLDVIAHMKEHGGDGSAAE